jgi:hypothetical protein
MKNKKTANPQKSSQSCGFYQILPHSARLRAFLYPKREKLGLFGLQVPNLHYLQKKLTIPQKGDAFEDEFILRITYITKKRTTFEVVLW